MKARKQTKGGARKRPCPVHALAMEANQVIAAMNLIENRHAEKKELPLDDMTGESLRDRLDAIQIEASYREPTSTGGAAFLLALAGASLDLLTSTKLEDREQKIFERRCARLVEVAMEYLWSSDSLEWSTAAQYFCGAAIDRRAGRLRLP